MEEVLTSKYDMFRFLCDELDYDGNINQILIDGKRLVEIPSDTLLKNFELEYVYIVSDHRSNITRVNLREGIKVSEIVEFVTTLLNGYCFVMYDENTRYVPKPDKVITIPSVEYVIWCCYKLDGEDFVETQLQIPYICYFRSSCNGFYSAPWVDLSDYEKRFCHQINKMITDKVDYWSEHEGKYYRFIIPEKLPVSEVFKRIEEEALKRWICFSIVD